MGVSEKEREAVTIAVEAALDDLKKHQQLMMKLLVLGPGKTLHSGEPARDIATVLRNAILVAMGMMTLAEADRVNDGEKVLAAAAEQDAQS